MRLRRQRPSDHGPFGRGGLTSGRIPILEQGVELLPLPDQELAAIHQALRALERLEPAVQARVLRYLIDRLPVHVELEPIQDGEMGYQIVEETA